MRGSILSFLLMYAVLALAGADFYAILGVSRSATEKEIKAAYRALSKKYHPDKNIGDESAQAKFMEIGGAYEVLIDQEKRQIYDQFGEEGLQGQRGGGGQNPFGDMFQQFFNGGQQQQRQKPKAQTLSLGVGATLYDYFNGKQADTAIRITDICDHCNGSGSNDGKLQTCTTCNGRGMIRKTQKFGPGMVQQFDMPCQVCRGQGKQIKNPCKVCHGQAVVEKEKLINIHVQPGSESGNIEILKGEGQRLPNVEPGDLQIIYQEDPSLNMGYRRSGHNLYRTELITLNESLHGGWSRDIDFLDSYHPKLKLSKDQGDMTPDGHVDIIRGKGMPLKDDIDEFGDLYVEYRVVYPLGASNDKIKKVLRDEL